MSFDPSELQPPRPRPTPTTRPYWDALREHRLVVQHCGSCGTWVHYPRARCTSCGAADLSFETVDPAATIHTFTISRQPTAPHFHGEVPQVLAIVELPIGVRLSTTLVVDDLHPVEALVIGARVEPVFDDGADGITLLRYRTTFGGDVAGVHS